MSDFVVTEAFLIKVCNNALEFCDKEPDTFFAFCDKIAADFLIMSVAFCNKVL